MKSVPVLVVVAHLASLPLRERGLKYVAHLHPPALVVSLPLRERGLKYYLCIVKKYVAWSLPLRERGLKFVVLVLGIKKAPVAPFTGAWIEIVWPFSYFAICFSSLPLRERGLKSRNDDEGNGNPESLPLRERGLKC